MTDHNNPCLQEILPTLEEAVVTVPLAELPALLGTLERVKALGWGRMLAGPHNGQQDSGLLTTKDVAQRLKISGYRAYELVRQGEIKKTSVGEKSVRVNPSDLAAYLTKQRSG